MADKQIEDGADDTARLGRPGQGSNSSLDTTNASGGSESTTGSWSHSTNSSASGSRRMETSVTVSEPSATDTLKVGEDIKVIRFPSQDLIVICPILWYY